MKITIFNDAGQKPQLFNWDGAIDVRDLSTWFEKRKLKIPQDLFDFYCTTGGGTIFEGETILGPYGNKNLGDDLEGMNKYHWEKGMPKNYLIFHTGLDLTVIDMNTFEYIVLSKDYHSLSIYESLDEWYINHLRNEYASRYGLK